ncbi:MAG: hypothetical protein V1690_02680 [Candidatus Moraniibacteriota bacterium]
MPKKIKKITVLLPLLLIMIFAPVYAAVSQEGWNPDALKVTNLPDRPVATILLDFIGWAIIIIGLLGVIIFIYAGFLYLTAQGETDKIETAKKVMIYAIVGIAVAVLGYVAVKTINDVLVGNVGSGASSGAPASSAPAPGVPPPGDTSAPMPVAPGMMGGQ